MPAARQRSRSPVDGVGRQRDDRQLVVQQTLALPGADLRGGSKPSISGIWQSIRTRSKGSCSKRSSAILAVIGEAPGDPERFEHGACDLPD
jgi:hypothetical protein